MQETATLNMDHPPTHNAQRTQSWIRCDGHNQNVIIAFPYSPTLSAAAKTSVPGLRPGPAANTWQAPFTSLARAVAFGDKHQIAIHPETRTLATNANRMTEHTVTSANVYIDQSGQLCVAADKDPRLMAALRHMNNGFATWNAERYVHVIPTHSPFHLQKIIDEFELTVADDARAVIDAETARQAANRRAATAATINIPMPDLPGVALDQQIKPAQWVATHFALTHKRVFLGDAMGFGKSATALSVLAAAGAYPAVVVCRPSLTEAWAEEIEKFLPYVNVYRCDSQEAQPIPGDTDVIVIASHDLAYLPPGRRNADVKLFSWATAINRLHPKALIIDEGQDVKEATSNRSQATEQVAAPIREADGFILNLTGTALLHYIRDLAEQLSIMGLIEQFGGKQRFLWRYCVSPDDKSKHSEQRATYNGRDNVEELAHRLLEWGIMVRRTDPEIMGLPPFTTETINVDAADLDPAAMAEYRKAERDIRGYLADRRRKLVMELGGDADEAELQAAWAADGANHLTAMNTLRTLLGRAKRPVAMAWIRQQVAAGEKVVVAADRREEVAAYAKAFDGLRLQGGQSSKEQIAHKKRFNTDPNARVFAISITAGGTGHTLHACTDNPAATGPGCNRVLQVELTWGPGDEDQLAKRIHRIGQTRPCTAYRLVARADTNGRPLIDAYLADMIETKRATLNAVLDRDFSGLGVEDAADPGAASRIAWAYADPGYGGRA